MDQSDFFLLNSLNSSVWSFLQWILLMVFTGLINYAVCFLRSRLQAIPLPCQTPSAFFFFLQEVVFKCTSVQEDISDAAIKQMRQTIQNDYSAKESVICIHFKWIDQFSLLAIWLNLQLLYDVAQINIMGYLILCNVVRKILFDSPEKEPIPWFQVSIPPNVRINKT